MMPTFRLLLLLALIVCAVATAIVKKPLQAIIIYTSYSVIMSLLWLLMESPDLGITEAAVGAGVTSILFFLTLRSINQIDRESAQSEAEHRSREEAARNE